MIALPAFIGAVALYAVAHSSHWNETLDILPSGAAIVVLGVAGTSLALARYLCTGMIWAHLPFRGEWATPLGGSHRCGDAAATRGGAGEPEGWRARQESNL